MQWLGISRQPAQRTLRGPPRARKGFEARARRVVRRRETAWGIKEDGELALANVGKIAFYIGRPEAVKRSISYRA
jgi:hypothetical protein